MKTPIEVQVSNILRWALPRRERYLVQFQKDRGAEWQKWGYKAQLEWERGLSLNPIMENAGDCGISGEELHQRYKADRIEAECHMQRVAARYASPGASKPFYSDMRIVSVLDDSLMTKLHDVGYPAPTIGEWLAANGFTPDTFPLVSLEECSRICAPAPKKKKTEKAIREGTVAALAESDEGCPVDVAYGRDGVSDDCFVTTAGEMVNEGFGGLRYEGDEDSATVWGSRSKFFDLMEKVG